MRKITLLAVLLIFSVLLFGCNNENQESQKTEEEIEVSKQEESEKIIIKSEEEFLPSFTSIDMPSISLLSSSGEVKNSTLDHSYEEVCWKNCDDINQYNYPAIHSGEVEVGDQLQIEWSSLKPQPAEIHLIQIDNSDESNLRELSKEQIDPENTIFKITIDEEMIGNQYALELLWKDESSTEGKSVMNFKLGR